MYSFFSIIKKLKLTHSHTHIFLNNKLYLCRKEEKENTIYIILERCLNFGEFASPYLRRLKQSLYSLINIAIFFLKR